MKPSERIHELASGRAIEALLGHAPDGKPITSKVYGTDALVRGLLEYLDEREAMDARREQVRYAMACIRCGGLTEATRVATELGLNPLRLTHEWCEHEYEIGLYKLAQEAGIFPAEIQSYLAGRHPSTVPEGKVQG